MLCTTLPIQLQLNIASGRRFPCAVLSPIKQGLPQGYKEHIVISVAFKPETSHTNTALTRCRHILKTVKNVPFSPADFETVDFENGTLTSINLKQHHVNTRQ